MINFEYAPLKITVKDAGHNIVMSWVGKSDFQHPASHLMPYLDDFISKLNKTELSIEFTRLEYMNSSTVPPLIHLLKELNNREIKTTVTYDKNAHWQVMSFKAFETLSKMMKYIKVTGV